MTKASIWLDEEQFSAACAALPLISIDWVITNPDLDVLLGLRRNAPARNYWFTPGGRIRKNEAFADAVSRVAYDELAYSGELGQATPMGVWDHFYQDSAFNSGISTHYINLPHWLPLSWAELAKLHLKPNDQHSDWCWMPVVQAEAAVSVHPYAQNYARWLNQRVKVDD